MISTIEALDVCERYHLSGPLNPELSLRSMLVGLGVDVQAYVIQMKTVCIVFLIAVLKELEIESVKG